MEMQSGPEFLEVNALLERSQPKPRVSWMGYGAGVFLLIVLVSAYITAKSPQFESAVDAFSRMLLIAVMVGMAVLMNWTVRRQRAEIRRVEALEELVQLRRWAEGAGLAQDTSHSARAIPTVACPSAAAVCRHSRPLRQI